MHSPYMLGEQSCETQIASWDVASGGRVGDTAGEWRPAETRHCGGGGGFRSPLGALRPSASRRACPF